MMGKAAVPVCVQVEICEKDDYMLTGMYVQGVGCDCHLSVVCI